MTRKPVFWIIFALLAVAGTAVAVKYFGLGFPLVTLDIRMDRDAALSRARALAAERHWGPADSRQAASFELDSKLQAFVELEGGGGGAFARVLSEGLVSPYTWEVRLFREHEANETRVRFTPEGTPYGFAEKIPESQAGPALEREAARRIAEDGARGGWSVDLDAFRLVEASQETRPGKRVDHTFVYERPDVRLGEGRYRLRLTVSGDRLTELTHFLKVPEGFDRRYEEMRSRNQAIAGVDWGVIALFYFGGIVVGLFFLLRRRYVLWKTPLKWAALVGVLYLAAQLSQWPLLWMDYDTATSATSFAVSQLGLALLAALGAALPAALAFIAAETFTRRAFPRHLQLWRIWSPDVARSRTVLGLTIAAYLSLGLLLAYEVGLYALARRHLGWWMPASPLGDPNIVASYFPWLTAIAIPLQAGFFEETLFRAVPLALAALLGDRFGGRRWWIAGTVVVQAVVFGAAHATYAVQPPWARLVEIAIPFALVGIVYLAFGLLPAIVLHFAYDVIFFSLPLFASSAPGIVVDRVIVILLALVPVWVVLYARFRAGAWSEAPAEARNAAWTPGAPPLPAPEPAARSVVGLGPKTRGALIALGALGLVAWVIGKPLRNDAPPLRVSSSQARAAARQALDARGVRLDASWKELARTAGDVGAADRFVWQEGGSEVYSGVMGTHIEAPHWLVRYARFEGADVAERAEEYVVRVDGKGQAVRIEHTLPEARPGRSLEEGEARALARSAVASAFGLDAGVLKEVSAEPEQKPARRDWRFVFSNPAVKVGGAGEARLEVSLAGDEVVDAFRFVHVPEEWSRAEQDRSTSANIIKYSSFTLLVVMVLAGAAVAIVRWSRRRFAARTFAVLFLGLAVLIMTRTVNNWPVVSSGFSTSQPWALQAGMVVVGLLMGAGAVAAGFALNTGCVHRAIPPQPLASRTVTILASIGLGAAWVGLGAVARMLARPREPVWAGFDAAATLMPALGVVLVAVLAWIEQTAFLLLVFAAVDAATRGWTRRRTVFSLVFLAVGLAAAGVGGVETVGSWLIRGAVTGIVLVLCYVLILRHHVAVLPGALATAALLELAREAALGAFPGALVGSAVAIVALAGLALLWLGRLERDSRATVTGVPAID
jgi:hypothetical protein